MNQSRFRFRDAVEALSDPPERRWPDGAIHHGARVLVLAALAFVVYLLFPVAPVPDFPVLERGMVAEEDVIAEVGFPIYKPDEVLAAERAEAAASVSPIYRYDPSAVDTMLTRVNGFMQRVDSIAVNEPAATARSSMRDLLASYGLAVVDDAAGILLSAQRRQLDLALRSAIREELPTGIVPSSELEETVAPQIWLSRAETDRLVHRDSLLTAPRFFERARDHLPPGAAPELAELQRLILIRFFQPSVRYDETATEAARDRARQTVPEIRTEVLQGERIIAAHEPVGDEELMRLRAYQEHLAQLGELGPGAGNTRRGIGAFLFDLLILAIGGVVLYFFRPGVYADMRHVMLIGLVGLAVTAAAAVIAHGNAPPELIPIAFPALVLAVLWDGRIALDLSLVFAILIAGQSQYLGLSTLFTLVLAGAVAALTVRVVRRRAQTWIFVSIIAGAYAAAAITLGLARSRTVVEVVQSAGWGTVSAVVSALLAMGMLPLFEAFTRITTDQRLLELSDLDHPLLQRLRREAPGTFSHSINVANLAEAAAQAIGANPLLARVGVYYHDIGKIPKPQYFIENQPQGRNPHDKLKPATSASIVRNHVLDGLRLAEEHGLPDVIRDVIAEHHGTQPISFFMDRAREENGGEEPDPSEFRYPGPRPRSKETAIAMLADSAESATRALQEPTPERIREVVHRVIADKLELGQLDDAPVTLGEVSAMEDEFVRVLSGMYHHRIDYPFAGEEHAPEPEPAPPSPATQRG